jgi:hypothetical protein
VTFFKNEEHAGKNSWELDRIVSCGTLFLGLVGFLLGRAQESQYFVLACCQFSICLVEAICKLFGIRMSLVVEYRLRSSGCTRCRSLE